jgi:hypothetical protein
MKTEKYGMKEIMKKMKRKSKREIIPLLKDKYLFHNNIKREFKKCEPIKYENLK